MKILMTFRAIAAIYIGAMFISLPTIALAEDKLDIGKMEYEAACAVCHGLTGKGDDGLLKELLAKPMPNLTALAKNNKGVFPFDRVYQIIDGRQEVKAHGSRKMPIWGNTFNNQSSVYFRHYPPYDSESAARSRILALTEYIYRLQE